MRWCSAYKTIKKKHGILRPIMKTKQATFRTDRSLPMTDPTTKLNAVLSIVRRRNVKGVAKVEAARVDSEPVKRVVDAVADSIDLVSVIDPIPGVNSVPGPFRLVPDVYL